MRKIEDMLRRHEGTGPIVNGRMMPYRCPAGKLTIGWGRNIEDRGISPAEANLMLRNDIAGAEHEADRFDWFDDLSDARKDVIVMMIFNMGLPRFKTFRKMIAALDHGDYFQAAEEMLDSKWAKQVGFRADELAEIMRAGTWD